ncbi:SDR family oxidoreductase [Christensenellaceae bacterium OttesenSCG-928-K19]|nr:SDR family oxidoreductase [Christensenellaceae bacterium OttesenSCG-928-K19]
MKKTAIVTGASNGLGKAIALMLAKEGYDILVNYYSDEASANKVADEIRSNNVDAACVKADVGKMEGVQAIFDAAMAAFGRVDVLVNNAGVFFDGMLFDREVAEFDKTMDVILRGTFFLTKLVGAQMKEQNIQGRIINISSALSQDFADMPIDYCVAKAGLNMMTKAIARELGPFGITCNAVLPSTIPTKINRILFDDPVMAKKLKDSTALKALGEPEDISQAVKYFVGEHSQYTTGAILSVDGGYSSKI